MPEENSASVEKAVAKVKIDLKSTKVNKKSVEFNNNNNTEKVPSIATETQPISNAANNNQQNVQNLSQVGKTFV